MKECPKCGGMDSAIILCGLSDDSSKLKTKIKNKRVVFGGCYVDSNDPKLECNDCGWRY